MHKADLDGFPSGKCTPFYLHRFAEVFNIMCICGRSYVKPTCQQQSTAPSAQGQGGSAASSTGAHVAREMALPHLQEAIYLHNED
eukprot:c17672_g1_i1 orf=268-522(-)